MSSQTFNFNSGVSETYTVTSPGTLTIVATGAQGGVGMGNSAGGLGGQVTGTLNIISVPQTFIVVVGGQGGNGAIVGVIPTGGAGGVGAIEGGTGGSSSETGLAGGGGGAASTVQVGTSLLLVAAGGGGGGTDSNKTPGGAGGGVVGGNGVASTTSGSVGGGGGTGGTNSLGGQGGAMGTGTTATPGGQGTSVKGGDGGQGGLLVASPGGGGGGGGGGLLSGGGGGGGFQGGSGGGGASFTSLNFTNVSNTSGVQTGSGQVTFTFVSTPVVPVMPTLLTFVCPKKITVCQPFHDIATLTCGNDPTGTLTFQLYLEDTVICTQTVEVFPRQQVYKSPPFKVFKPGKYHFVVTYSGDSNNQPVTSDPDDPLEIVHVLSKCKVLHPCFCF